MRADVRDGQLTGCRFLRGAEGSVCDSQLCLERGIR